ncbi:MAG TPA: S-layer homology domain-containing protein [Oscillatoriaceae cyanobacterium]
MATPKKKAISKQLPAARGTRKRRGKKKRKAALPQLIGGITLVLSVGGLMALGAYLAARSLPQDVPTAQASPLPRPSIDPQYDSVTPQRPGLAEHEPDEIYYPQASDLDGMRDGAAIAALLDKGVLTVFADGKFRPSDPIPRAEFVTWCYNAVMAQSAPGPDPFKIPRKGFETVTPRGDAFGDVSADYWAAGVLASVKASGILGSAGQGYFRPDAPLTREEWLVLASRFASSKAAIAKLAPPQGDALAIAYRRLNYTDLSALNPAFTPYAAYVFGDDRRAHWVDAAFMPPVTPGPWHPQAWVTRGEAAHWIAETYAQIGKDSL